MPLLDTPDILPTLLSLSDIPIPDTVEGRDFSATIEGGEDPSGGAALIYCPHPFGQFFAPGRRARIPGAYVHATTPMRAT